MVSRRLTRHVPLVLLAAAILSMVSCQHDEPQVHRPGEHDSIVTPIDTVHPADTTTHQPNDTTTPQPSDSTGAFTLLLSAPRDYGYMGQTLQLTAETSDSATITWKSSNTLAATVNDQGLVNITSLSADAQTTITATAEGVTDSLTLRCLHWAVAAMTGGTWSTTPYHQVHQGDTMEVTITGSGLTPINDEGFNAASCQWSVSCRQAEVSALFAKTEAPSQANGWQMRYVISPSAPTGVTFTVMARFGEAASTLQCIVMP